MPNSTTPETPELAVRGHVLGFPDGPGVDVRELDAVDWEVLKAFTYVAQEESYTIDIGQKTDFASIPRPVVWFIPTYGKYTKAAILHDHLCDLSHQGKFSRRDADGIFRQAMRVLGVAFLRRWIMWAGVRLGALESADGRKDWWRDAWRVALIGLLVLPIILPAAALVTLTLVVWWIVEVVFFLLLHLGRRLKPTTGKPAKKINMPRLSFRL